MKQELAENLDLVVACLEVVQCIEKAEYEVIECPILPMLAKCPTQFEQQIFLQSALAGLVFHCFPSSIREESFKIVKDLFYQLLNKNYLHLLCL